MALRTKWILVLGVLSALESTVRPKSSADPAAPAVSVSADDSAASSSIAKDFAAAGTSTKPPAASADTNAAPELSGNATGTNIVNTNLAMADYFINVRQPEKAEPLLVALLAGNIPESLQKIALFKLATTVRDENDLPRAQTIYTQYTQRWPADPKVPEILLRQGQMFRAMGLNDLALAKFYSVMTAALALKDDQFSYYQSLVLQTQVEIAETHYYMGQFADAADFYQRLIQSADPNLNRRQVQFHLIRSLSIIGRNDQAVAQAQDFTTRFPEADEVPETRYYLAQSLKALGRNAEALQQVLLCLQQQKSRTAKNPELWAYWQQRVGNEVGNELYHEGDYVKALEVYVNLVDLDPSPRWQIPVDYQLGMTYEKLLQPAKAIDTYQAIVTKESDLGTNNTPALKAVFDMARWRINFIQWQTNADAVDHSISLSSAALNSTNPPPASTRQ